VRHAYNKWMDEAVKEYIPKGKIKWPLYSLVATWIKEAWDNIDPAMIQ
ncbi:15949_t:CDS:1, partial [Funneliformis geosporum]